MNSIKMFIMISIKKKIFVKKLVNSLMVKSIKIQLRIKIKLTSVMITTLMVPHTSTKVLWHQKEKR